MFVCYYSLCTYCFLSCSLSMSFNSLMCNSQIWSIIIWWITCKSQIWSFYVQRLSYRLGHRWTCHTSQWLHPSSISIDVRSCRDTCSTPHISMVVMQYRAGILRSKSWGSNPATGRIFIIIINFWSNPISKLMTNSMNMKKILCVFHFSGVLGFWGYQFSLKLSKFIKRYAL